MNTNRILEHGLHACHATLSVCGIRYERLLRSHVPRCVPWQRDTSPRMHRTNVNYVFDTHEIRLNGLIRELTPHLNLHTNYFNWFERRETCNSVVNGSFENLLTVK